MLRTLDILSIAALIAAASWTFHVKHESDMIESQIRKVERDIRAEKQAIAILSTDWTLLNQPTRLQKLSETYAEELKLASVRPDQIVAENELPAPPPPKIDEVEEPQLVASRELAAR